MTIELTCRTCHQPYTPSRAELIAGPRIYRECRSCREIPRVPVTATWRERSRVWLLTIARCPFCHEPHTHGGGSDAAPDLGARRSPCLSGDGGTYILVAAADTERVA